MLKQSIDLGAFDHVCVITALGPGDYKRSLGPNKVAPIGGVKKENTGRPNKGDVKEENGARVHPLDWGPAPPQKPLTMGYAGPENLAPLGSGRSKKQLARCPNSPENLCPQVLKAQKASVHGS